MRPAFLKGWLAVIVLACHTMVLSACHSPSDSNDDPLTDEEIGSVTPPDFAKLAQAYENVRREKPNVSEESNEFSHLLLDEVERLSTSSSANRVAVVYPWELGRQLTAAEWQLIWTNYNWVKVPGMFVIVTAAMNRAAGEFPAATLHNGTGDAFRHAYWNVRMAKFFGTEWAREWATAHESETPAGDEKTMDLNNNEVGRNLLDANPMLDADALAEKIKALPVVCTSSGATHDPTRLVYITNCPTLRVFDDGPDFDDVFQVTLDGSTLGTTPAGGGTTFQTNGLLTGPHSLRVLCTLDGTHGGCGFEVSLAKGLTFPNGATSTSQLSMDQGGTQTLTVVAPTLSGLLSASLRVAPVSSASNAHPVHPRM